jgi:hypothetical protein
MRRRMNNPLVSAASMAKPLVDARFLNGVAKKCSKPGALFRFASTGGSGGPATCPCIWAVFFPRILEIPISQITHVTKIGRYTRVRAKAFLKGNHKGLKVKFGAYWNLVRYRIEQHQNRIRISRARVKFAGAIMPPPGSPPFEYWPPFLIAGWRPVSQAEEDEARELFRQRDAMRRVDREYRSPQEFASGIYGLEIRDAREKAFSRRVYRAPIADDAYARGYMAALGPKAQTDNGLAAAIGPWRQGAPPISHDEWDGRGYSVSSLPDGLMLAREDRELLARILEQSPGRARGRPPVLAERGAMTTAERKRRSRALKTFVPHERPEPGIIVPPPQGSAVPGHSIEDGLYRMLTQLEQGFAEKYHERLGELLDRLATAPPDTMVSRPTLLERAAALVEQAEPLDDEADSLLEEVIEQCRHRNLNPAAEKRRYLSGGGGQPWIALKLRLKEIEGR